MASPGSPQKRKRFPECNAAFEDLKQRLCQEPELQTDASAVDLGAVLLQGEEDDRRPVQYIS